MNQNPQNPTEKNPLGYTPYKPSANSPSKLLFKILALGGLLLALLVPLLLIQNMVDDRERYASDVEEEIATKWGGKQDLLTPMLCIPYRLPQANNAPNAKEELVYVQIPAQTLDVNAQLSTQIRKRNIYTIPVYTANVQINGTWSLEDLPELAPGEEYLFERAKIEVGIVDSKGVRRPKILVQGQEFSMSKDRDYESNLISEDYDYDDPYKYEYWKASYPIVANDSSKSIVFSMPLQITGLSQFHVTPFANSAKVTMQSDWKDPSFNGDLLPETSKITNQGFTASWEVFNNETPQKPDAPVRSDDNDYEQITTYDDGYMPNTVGFKLYKPLENYELASRSVKYGILIILLTFLSIFFIEIGFRKHDITIHLFHYLLSGLALVLFFSLLLSFSEVIGFGWAYLVSAIMIVGLNFVYFRMIFKKMQLALILSGIMLFLYGATYVLMTMQTYAMLVGSLGLFVLLAIVMMLSAKLIK